MEDSAVLVFELEDSIFNGMDYVAKVNSRQGCSPTWELTTEGLFTNEEIFLEKHVPSNSDSASSLSPPSIQASPEFTVSPLEGVDFLTAIPDDFFVSPTQDPEPQVIGHRIFRSVSDEDNMDDVCRGVYVDNSSSDWHRDDSDSSLQRRKRRRYEEEPSTNPDLERSRRNAIIAKRNRERKKKLLETLQTSVDKLTTENRRLVDENSQLRRKVASLEEEMFTLKSTLMRASGLSSLLLSIKKNQQSLLPEAFKKLQQN